MAGEPKGFLLQQSAITPGVFTEADFVSFNKIASGKFANVFKIKHKVWRVNLALKCCHLLREESSTFERDMKYLMEVAGKTLRVKFKHILPVYGICTRPAGIVMEYLENGSLDKLLLKDTLPWPMKFQIIHETSLGMNFLHSMKPPLLHLELKARNILLDENLHVKIADFGLSKWEDSMSNMEQIERSAMRGTIIYMPPELSNKPSGVEHDVYSFSIVTWEVVTQQRPYAGTDILAVFVKVVAGERPCLKIIPEDGPPGCAQVVELMQRCWNQEPKRRPLFSEIVVETEMLCSLLQFPDIDSSKTTEKARMCLRSPHSSLQNGTIISEIASYELQKLSLLSGTETDGEISIDSRRELLHSLLESDLSHLKRIFRKEHVSWNFVQDYTLMHLSVLTGDVEFVQLVLESGGCVNDQTSRGATPLILAVQYRFVHLCKLLIQEGAIVNLVDEDKWAPLHFASQNGDDHIARLLLDKDAQVNVKEADGWTPLHLASQNSHENVIRVLFTRGADTSSLDHEHCSCLHLAAYYGYYSITKLLITQGANLNEAQTGLKTPLHLAATRGFFRVARLLVNSGADINSLDHSHYTPLHLAALNGHTGICRHLLKHGADAQQKSLQNWIPLHLAALKGHTSTVRLLMEHLSDLNVGGDLEWTSLHLATCYSQEDVVSELLERGANPNATEASGWTPLHLAAHGGRFRCLAKLLDHQANVNAVSHTGWTSLHVAAVSGSVNIVRMLIMQGADLKAQDQYLNTPLQLATKHLNHNVASVLSAEETAKHDS
ncbi:ankyrin repeat and protein kinase domain-containing protein 1 isoform X1 [Amblyraja radiata]|uniref:ankyrin repeat and protein kinase domain-containing protein 1 isoform X1 n=1 Tax=Amblyraja radiata TaxID=386614 RepID=UPI001403CFFE|nr:ankyrin repeat and protein kinase domain-containing protein 1 isoform X1 [Amblyraja radiata]